MVSGRLLKTNHAWNYNKSSDLVVLESRIKLYTNNSFVRNMGKCSVLFQTSRYTICFMSVETDEH